MPSPEVSDVVLEVQAGAEPGHLTPQASDKIAR